MSCPLRDREHLPLRCCGDRETSFLSLLLEARKDPGAGQGKLFPSFHSQEGLQISWPGKTFRLTLKVIS